MGNEYEMTILENISPEDAAKQMPVIIRESIDSLKKIQEKIQTTKKNAEEAKEQAENAWLVEVGFWHRTTPALEALQRAGKCQSEAIIGISECQELLFQQQYILAQCSKFLFMLCCANLAAARIAVREIQARLQNASEEEISDIAKNELQKTMQQLKQQMDLLERQDRLQDKVGKLDAEIKQKEQEIELQKSQIGGLEKQLSQCNSVVAQQHEEISCLEKKDSEKSVHIMQLGKKLQDAEERLTKSNENLNASQQRIERNLASDFEKMQINSKKQVDDFCSEYQKKLEQVEDGHISKKITKIQRLLVVFIVLLLFLCAGCVLLFMKIVPMP